MRSWEPLVHNLGVSFSQDSRTFNRLLEGGRERERERLSQPTMVFQELSVNLSRNGSHSHFKGEKIQMCTQVPYGNSSIMPLRFVLGNLFPNTKYTMQTDNRFVKELLL